MNYSKKKNKDLLYKILLGLLIAFLLLNRGARTIVKHFFDERRLEAGIEKTKQENESLKSQIYSLEHSQSYLTRAVKNEYKVISDGEIEYRFKV